MPEFAGIVFRAADGSAPTTPDLTKVREALARLKPTWWSADDAGAVLRLRVPVLFTTRRAVVVVAPQGAQPASASSETLAYVIAVEGWKWGRILFAAFLLVFAFSFFLPYVYNALVLAGFVGLALVVLRWIEQRVGLPGVRSALRRAFGAKAVLVRRIYASSAPAELHTALDTGWPDRKPFWGVRSASAAAPPGPRFSLNPATISSLMPALVSGIFSITTAVIVFGLEDARRESDREQREHDITLEEIRSRRPLSMEAVRYYLDHQEELAAGDARSQRTMTILRSVAPPDIYCVLAEAYAQTAQTPEETLPLYNTSTLWRVVQQAPDEAFGSNETQLACLGSADERQVAIEGRVEGYVPPTGGDGFQRHPTGGGGQIPETATPSAPQGTALRETSVLVFSPSGARSVPRQRADDLGAARFSVAGVFTAPAPPAPVVVYFNPEQRAAAELLAAFADLWTYTEGRASTVRVVRADPSEPGQPADILELWLPN